MCVQVKSTNRTEDHGTGQLEETLLSLDLRQSAKHHFSCSSSWPGDKRSVFNTFNVFLLEHRLFNLFLGCVIFQLAEKVVLSKR